MSSRQSRFMTISTDDSYFSFALAQTLLLSLNSLIFACAVIHNS